SSTSLSSFTFFASAASSFTSVATSSTTTKSSSTSVRNADYKRIYKHSIIRVDRETGECAPMSVSRSQNFSVARVLYTTEDKLYFTAVSDIENGQGSTALVALNMTSGTEKVVTEASGMLTNETLAVGTTITTNTSVTSDSVIFLGMDGHNVTIYDVDSDAVIETTDYVADRYVDAISASIHQAQVTSAVFLAYQEPSMFEVVEFVYNSTTNTHRHRLLFNIPSDPRNVSTLTPNRIGNYDYDGDGDLDILVSHVNLTGVTHLLQVQEFEFRDQSNTHFDVYKNNQGQVDQETYKHVKSASLVDMHLPTEHVETGIKLINMNAGQLSTVVRVTFPPLPPAPPLPQQMSICMDRPAHMIHGETLVGLTEMYGGLCYEVPAMECNDRAPCHMNIAKARCEFSLEHFLRHNWVNFLESEFQIAKNPPGVRSSFFVSVVNKSADYRLYGSKTNLDIMNVAPVTNQSWYQEPILYDSTSLECGDNIVNETSSVIAANYDREVTSFTLNFTKSMDVTNVGIATSRVYESVHLEAQIENVWTEVARHKSSELYFTFAWPEFTVVRTNALRLIVGSGYWYSTSTRSYRDVDDTPNVNFTKIHGCSVAPNGTKYVTVPAYVRESEEQLASSLSVDNYDETKDCDVYGMSDDVHYDQDLGIGRRYLLANGDQVVTYGTQNAVDGTRVCAGALFDDNVPAQLLPYDVSVSSSYHRAGVAYRFMSVSRNISSVVVMLYASQYDLGSPSLRSLRVRYIKKGLHGSFTDVRQQSDRLLEGGAERRAINVTIRFEPVLTRALLITYEPDGDQTSNRVFLHGVRIFEMRTPSAPVDARSDYAFYANPRTSNFLLTGSKQARHHAGDLQPISSSSSSLGAFGNTTLDDNYVIAQSEASNDLARMMQEPRFTLMFWTMMNTRYSYGHWFRDSVHLRTEDQDFIGMELVKLYHRYAFYVRYGRGNSNPTTTSMDEHIQYLSDDLDHKLDGKQNAAQFVALVLDDMGYALYVGGLDPESTKLELIMKGEPPYETYSIRDPYKRGAIGDALHAADPISSNWYYSSRSTYKYQSPATEYDHLRTGHNVTERYSSDWPRNFNILVSDVNKYISRAVNDRTFTFSFWMMMDGRGGASEYNIIRLTDFADDRRDSDLSRCVEMYLYGDGSTGDRRIRAEVAFYMHRRDSHDYEYQYYRIWNSMWFYRMDKLQGDQKRAQMVTFVMHPNATLDIYIGNMDPDKPNVTAIVKGKFGTYRTNLTESQVGYSPDWSDWYSSETYGNNFYNLSNDGRIVFNKRRNNVKGLMAFSNVLLLNKSLSQSEVTRLFETGLVMDEHAENLVAWYPMMDNWWEDISSHRSHFTEYLFTQESFSSNSYSLSDRRVLAEHATAILAGNRSSYFLRARATPYQFLTRYNVGSGYRSLRQKNMETVPDHEQRWMIAEYSVDRFIPVSANDVNLRESTTDPACVSIENTEFDNEVKYMMTYASGVQSPLANGDRLFTKLPRNNGRCPKSLLDDRSYKIDEGYESAQVDAHTDLIYAFGSSAQLLSAVKLTLSVKNSQIQYPKLAMPSVDVYAYNFTSSYEAYTFWGVVVLNASTSGVVEFDGFELVDNRGTSVDINEYYINRNATADSPDPSSYGFYRNLNEAIFEDPTTYLDTWRHTNLPLLYIELKSAVALRSFKIISSTTRMPLRGFIVASVDSRQWTPVGNWNLSSATQDVTVDITSMETFRVGPLKVRYSSRDFPPDADSTATFVENITHLDFYQAGRGHALIVAFDPLLADAVYVSIREEEDSYALNIMELRLYASEPAQIAPSPPPPFPYSPRPPPAMPFLPPVPPTLFTLPRVGVESLSTSNWYVFGRGDVDASTNTYQYDYKAHTEYTDFPDDWERHNGIMSELDEELASAFNGKNRAGSTGLTFVYFTTLAEGVNYESNNRWGMIENGGCGLTNGHDEVFNLGHIWTHNGWAHTHQGPYTYFMTGFSRSTNGDNVFNTMWGAHTTNHYEDNQFDSYQETAQMVAITMDDEHVTLYLGYDDTFEEVPHAKVAWHTNWKTKWANWDKAAFQCGFSYNQVKGGAYNYNNLILFNRSLSKFELKRLYDDGQFSGTSDPLLRSVLAWYPMHTGNWWQDVSGNERHLYEYRSPTYGTSNSGDRSFTDLTNMRERYLRIGPGEKSTYYYRASDPEDFRLAAYVPQDKNPQQIRMGYLVGSRISNVLIVRNQGWLNLPEWYTGASILVTHNDARNRAQDPLVCDTFKMDSWILQTYDRSYLLSNNEILAVSPYEVYDAISIDGYYPLYRRGSFSAVYEIPLNCSLMTGVWDCDSPDDVEHVEFAFFTNDTVRYYGNHTTYISESGCPTDLFDASMDTGWFIYGGLYNLIYLFDKPQIVESVSLALREGTVDHLRIDCINNSHNDTVVLLKDVVLYSELHWVNLTADYQSICESVRLRIIAPGGLTEVTLEYIPTEPLYSPPPPSPPPMFPPTPPRGMNVEGYFPVYAIEAEARLASPLADAFLIKLTSGYYYVPSGLTSGVSVWYGDYVGIGEDSLAYFDNTTNSSVSHKTWTYGQSDCPKALQATREECLGSTLHLALGAELGGKMTSLSYPAGCVYIIRSHNLAEVYHNDVRFSEVSCGRFAHVMCVCSEDSATHNKRFTASPVLDPRFDDLRYRLDFLDTSNPLRATDGNGKLAPLNTFNMTYGAPVIDLEVVPHGRLAGGSLRLNASNTGLRLSSSDVVLGVAGKSYESFTLSYWSRLQQEEDRSTMQIMRTIPYNRFSDERIILSPVTHAKELRAVEATADLLARQSPSRSPTYNGPQMIDGNINTFAYAAQHVTIMFNRSTFVEEVILVQQTSPTDTNRLYAVPENISWYALRQGGTGAYSQDPRDWELLTTTSIGHGGDGGEATTGYVWSHQRMSHPVSCTAIRAHFDNPVLTGTWPRYHVREVVAYGQIVTSADATLGPPYRSHQAAVFADRVRSEISPHERSHVDFARNNSLEAPLAMYWRLRILHVQDPTATHYHTSAGPYIEDETGRIVSRAANQMQFEYVMHTTHSGNTVSESKSYTYGNPPSFHATYWQFDMRDFWTFKYYIPQRPYRIRFKCGNHESSATKCPTLVSIEYSYNSSTDFEHLRNVSLRRYTRDEHERGAWRTVSIAEEDSGVTDLINEEHVRDTWVHTTAAFDSDAGVTRIAKFFSGNTHGGALHDAVSRATLPLDVPGEKNFEFGVGLMGNDTLWVSDVRTHAAALTWTDIEALHRSFRASSEDPYSVSLLSKDPVYPKSFGARIGSHIISSSSSLPYAFDSDTLFLQEPIGGDVVDRLRFAHRYVPAIKDNRSHALSFTTRRPTLVYLGVPSSLHADRRMNDSLYNQLTSWGGWSMSSGSDDCRTRIIPVGSKTTGYSCNHACNTNAYIAVSDGLTDFTTSQYQYLHGYVQDRPVLDLYLAEPVFVTSLVQIHRAESDHHYLHMGYMFLRPEGDPSVESDWDYLLRNEKGIHLILEHTLSPPVRMKGLRVLYMGEDPSVAGMKDSPEYVAANTVNPAIYLAEIYIYGCESLPAQDDIVPAIEYTKKLRIDTTGTLAAQARARPHGGYDPQESMTWYSGVADAGTHTLRCGDDDTLRDAGSHPAPHCAQTVIAFSPRDDTDAPRVLTPYKGALVGAGALRNSTPHTGTRPLGGDPTWMDPSELTIGSVNLWVYYDPVNFYGDNYYWRTGDSFIDEESPGPSQPRLAEMMRLKNLYNPYDHPGAILDGIVTPAFDGLIMKPDYRKPHINERDAHGDRIRMDAISDSTGDNRIGTGGYFRFDTNANKDFTVILDFDGEIGGHTTHTGRRFGFTSVEIYNKHHPGQSSSGNRDFVGRVEIHCAENLILTESRNPSTHEDLNWVHVPHPHVPGSSGKDLLRPIQRRQILADAYYELFDNEPTKIDLSKKCGMGRPMRYLRLRFTRIFSSSRSYGGIAELRVWGQETRQRDVDRPAQVPSVSLDVPPPSATAWRLDCSASGYQTENNMNRPRANFNEWSIYDEYGVTPVSEAFTSRGMPNAHLYIGSWARWGVYGSLPPANNLEETYNTYWATDGVYTVNSGGSVSMACPGSSIVHTFKTPVTPSSVVWVGNGANGHEMTEMRVFYANGNLSEPFRALRDGRPFKRYPPIGFTKNSDGVSFLQDYDSYVSTKSRATSALVIEVKVHNQTYGNGVYILRVDGTQRPGFSNQRSNINMFDHKDLRSQNVAQLYGSVVHAYEAYQIQTSPMFLPYNITIVLPEPTYLVWYELHPAHLSNAYHTPASWTVSAICEDGKWRELHRRDGAMINEWFTWRGTEYLVTSEILCAHYILTIRSTYTSGQLKLLEWVLFGSDTFVHHDEIELTWKEQASLQFSEDKLYHNQALSVPLNLGDPGVGAKHWSILIKDTIDRIGNLELMEASFLDERLQVIQPQETDFATSFTTISPTLLYDGIENQDSMYRSDINVNADPAQFSRDVFPVALNYTFASNSSAPQYLQLSYDRSAKSAPREIEVWISHGGVYWTHYDSYYIEDYDLHPTGTHRPVRFDLKRWTMYDDAPFAYCEIPRRLRIALDDRSDTYHKSALLTYVTEYSVAASSSPDETQTQKVGLSELERCVLSDEQSAHVVYLLGSCDDVADLLDLVNDIPSAELMLDTTNGRTAIVYDFGQSTTVERIEITLSSYELIKDVQLSYTRFDEETGEAEVLSFELVDELSGRDRRLHGPEDVDKGRTMVYIPVNKSVIGQTFRVEFGAAIDAASGVSVEGLRIYGESTNTSSLSDFVVYSNSSRRRLLGIEFREYPLPEENVDDNVVIVAGGYAHFEIVDIGSFVSSIAVEFLNDFAVPAKWQLQGRLWNETSWTSLHVQHENARYRTVVQIGRNLTEVKLFVDDMHVAPRYTLRSFEVYACDCENTSTYILPETATQSPNWLLPDQTEVASDLSDALKDVASFAGTFVVYNDDPIMADSRIDGMIGMQLKFNEIGSDGTVYALMIPDGVRVLKDPTADVLHLSDVPTPSVGIAFASTGMEGVRFWRTFYDQNNTWSVTPYMERFALSDPDSNASPGSIARLVIDKSSGDVRIMLNIQIQGQEYDDFYTAHLFDDRLTPIEHVHQYRILLISYEEEETSAPSIRVDDTKTRNLYEKQSCNPPNRIGTQFYISSNIDSVECGNFKRLSLAGDQYECLHFEHTLSRFGQWTREDAAERCTELGGTLMALPDFNTVNVESYASMLRSEFHSSYRDSAFFNVDHPLYKNLAVVLDSNAATNVDMKELEIALIDLNQTSASVMVPPVFTDIIARTDNVHGEWRWETSSAHTEPVDLDDLWRGGKVPMAMTNRSCAVMSYDTDNDTKTDQNDWYVRANADVDARMILESENCDAMLQHIICTRSAYRSPPPIPMAPLAPPRPVERFGGARMQQDPPMRVVSYEKTFIFTEQDIEIAQLKPYEPTTLPINVTYAYSSVPITVYPNNANEPVPVILHARGTILGCVTRLRTHETLSIRIVAYNSETMVAIIADDIPIKTTPSLEQPIYHTHVITEYNFTADRDIDAFFVRATDDISVSIHRAENVQGATSCYPLGDMLGGWSGVEGSHVNGENRLVLSVLRIGDALNETKQFTYGDAVRIDTLDQSTQRATSKRVYVGNQTIVLSGDDVDERIEMGRGAGRARFEFTSNRTYLVAGCVYNRSDSTFDVASWLPEKMFSTQFAYYFTQKPPIIGALSFRYGSLPDYVDVTQSNVRQATSTAPEDRIAGYALKSYVLESSTQLPSNETLITNVPAAHGTVMDGHLRMLVGSVDYLRGRPLPLRLTDALR
ncbi:hypothetical protein CYMTET_3544, partial [Cymbomonas tetramitiformis]